MNKHGTEFRLYLAVCLLGFSKTYKATTMVVKSRVMRHMRSEVLTDVLMSMLVFRVVTACGLVGIFQWSGVTHVSNYRP